MTYDYYSELNLELDLPLQLKANIFTKSALYSKKGETITISFEAKQTTNIKTPDFYILGNYTVEGFVIAGVNLSSPKPACDKTASGRKMVCHYCGYGDWLKNLSGVVRGTSADLRRVRRRLR